jgi:hypothetical protein
MVPSSSSSIEERTDFHIEEYKTLREEIMYLGREMRFLERAAVIGPVIAYSWLTIEGVNALELPMQVFAWWLPVFLVLFLMRRIHRTSNGVLLIAEYITLIENLIAAKSIGGWEHYIADRDKKNRNRQYLRLGDRLFWYSLISLWAAASSTATYFVLTRASKV